MLIDTSNFLVCPECLQVFELGLSEGVGRNFDPLCSKKVVGLGYEGQIWLGRF